MRRSVWVLCAVGGLAACGKPFLTAPSVSWKPIPLDSARAPSITDPEYGVYAFVAQSAAGKKQPGPALFRDSTWTIRSEGLFSPPPLQEGQESFREAIADLMQRGRVSKPLVDRFEQQLRVAFVGDSLFAPDTRPEAWKSVYRTYPRAGPVLIVSAVGFNADTTRAIVWVDMLCAPALCGNGGYWLLARAPGRRWVLWDRRILVSS